MRSYKTLSTNDWLNLVNSEADPDISKFNLSYVQLDGKYAVVIQSGYGIFLSPLCSDESSLDLEEEKVKKRYESAKGTGSVFQPKFNSLTTF